MKKVLFFVLLLMFCFCLSGQSIDNTPSSNENGVFIQEIKNITCGASYKIFEESDSKAYISITDDKNLDLEIRVLENNVEDALNSVFKFEKKLLESLLDLYEYETKLMYPVLKTSFVKSLIMIFMSDKEDYRWVKDSNTGKYYFEIDNRDKEIESYSYNTDDSYSYDSLDTDSFDNDSFFEHKTVTLTVLDYQDATSPSSFDNNKYIWEAFEESHPDIKIEREPLFGEPFHKKTDAYAASGRMPDVFYMWPTGRSSVIHEKKLAKDLTPFLKKDGIYDDYSKVSILPSMQKSGYVAEIPFGITVTSCMFANTKVLKELGLEPAKTYDELKAQLPILNAAGKELILMANQDDWVMQSCLFSMIMGRIGGENWGDDILSGKKKFTDAPFLTAVEMIDKMYKDGVLSQTSLATGYNDVTSQFANEEGAYFIDGDWRVGAFITDWLTGDALISPEKQESDIELIPFPSIPGENFPGSNSGTVSAGYGMSSALETGSVKEVAAWELIKWLSGPVCQQRRLDTGASFPSLVRGVDYSNLEPLSQKRAKYYETPTRVTPVFDSVFSASVSSVFNAKLQELGLGMTTPMEVCEAVQNAYEKEL